MDSHEVRELANRLQRVERRVLLMGAGWLLSVVLLVVFWIGAPYALSQTSVGPAKVRSLAIVDQNDRTRLLLGVSDAGNGIFRLFDSSGENRIELSVTRSGVPAAWFSDAKGKTRIRVAVVYDRMPQIMFADENGNERLHLGLADAETRSKFATLQPNPPQLWLAYDPTGPARLGFYAGGRERVALGGNGRGDQGIWVFDAGGRPVWSAPHGLFGGVKP